MQNSWICAKVTPRIRVLHRKMSIKYLIYFFSILYFSSIQVSMSASDTLEDIKQSKQINIGYRGSSIPLSFIDNTRSEPLGYNIDVCLSIIKNIKTELNISDLRVNFIKVDGASRIPMLTDKKIDLECGSTTHTLDRDKFVSFSVSTIIDEDQAITKKSLGIKSIADLNGKMIAVNPSSSITLKIRAIEIKDGYKFSRIYVPDHKEGFEMVQNDTAVAYIELRSVLAGLAYKSKEPENYTFLEEPFDEQPIAIMMRKGEQNLKSIADRTIVGMARNGELDKLYAKWFFSDISSLGGSLHLAKNTATIRQYRDPTDQPAAEEGIIIGSIFNLPVWLWGGVLVFSYLFLSLTGLYFFIKIFRKYPIEDKHQLEFSNMGLSAVGGMTSLIFGFTLVVTLTAYNTAANLVIEEANSIGVMQKNSVGIDAADKERIKQALTKYTKIVIDREWQDQREGLPVFSFSGNAAINDLHQIILNLDTTDKKTATIAQSALLQGINAIYKARMNRLFAATPKSKIPLILWIMLFTSSVVTITCSFLIGYRNRLLHYVTVSIISLTLSLFLVLILYIDRPYIGNKGVSSEPYQITLENFVL